jgi:hypothetical protein|tara:strand:- start:503 stop:973 length:471 start_codon:yes stop_codon:yes gene_type:complete
MGYEFKLKKGETRMNNLTKLIVAFILMLFLLPAFAEAQSMNPDSLLEVDPLVKEEPKVETPQLPTTQWQPLNRLLACNTMDYIKGLLLQRGQIIWVGGGKTPDYMPNDPFDSLIITRNPVTLEFTILIIKPEINLACIIAGGQEIKTIEEMGLDKE